MSEENDRPTKPMDPLLKIAKIEIELDETTGAIEFFQYVLKVLKSIQAGKKRRVSVFVQAEDLEEE